MASFNPVSEEEAKLAGLLKPGPGEFEVKRAEDKTSQNNNTYLNVMLRVWDADGREQTVWDMFMYEGAFAYRLREFCYSVGAGADYEAGNVEPGQLIGTGGQCKIGHGVDNRNAQKKNVVTEYLKGGSLRGRNESYPRSRETVMAGRPQARQPLPPSDTPPMEEADIPF